MVLGMGIDAIVLSKEFEVWDVFQYWSIPKIGLKSDNGRPAEFIAEKSNEFDKSNEVDMLLSQASSLREMLTSRILSMASLASQVVTRKLHSGARWYNEKRMLVGD
jgi:hypothetical protein